MRQNVTLVTGGSGFVGSNVVVHLLARDEDARVVVLDRAIDDLAASCFEEFGQRVRVHLGDITDPDVFRAVAADVTGVVHCATVAHVPRWELVDPAQFVHVNIVGTTNVLEWARHHPSLRRFLYVSSGGVYGEPTALSPRGPQPESGPFNPPELYAISKYASELVCRRYAELFGLDLRIVRLSWVFGPMERTTSGRALMSPPYSIARAILDDRPVRVTRRTLEAVGDFLSAEDAAVTIGALLASHEPRASTYNIAAGRLTTFRELFTAAADAHSKARYVVVADDDPAADLDHDPELRRARWNAYDTSRVRAEFGWSPRPLVEQLASYLAWVLADPARRCPAVPAEGGE